MKIDRPAKLVPMSIFSYETQLEAIRWIQQARGSWVDSFFRCWDFFDSRPFFFLLIAAIWVGFGRKIGLRTFFTIVAASLINSVFKDFFSQPRPCHIDPLVGLIHFTSFGFPSGGAQSAILLPGLLITHWKSRWAWGVGIVFGLLLSFSRVYLGVHFFTDILGGWLSGFIILALVLYLGPKIEARLENIRPFTSVVSLAGLGFFLLIFFKGAGMDILGISVGTALGHFFRIKLPNPKSAREVINRALVGALGALVIYSSLTALKVPSLARLFVAGMWVSFTAHMICWRVFYGRANLQFSR